jgi:hypothetical protein
MYRDVTELTRDELIELKQNYMFELADCGEFAEVMNREYNEPTYADLANADEIIFDKFIFEYYAGISFAEDDFFCNLKSNEGAE